MEVIWEEKKKKFCPPFSKPAPLSHPKGKFSDMQQIYSDFAEACCLFTLDHCKH